MNKRQLDETVRRWYEGEPGFDPSACPIGPEFAALIEFVHTQQGLSAEHLVHVRTCPKCARTMQAIQTELSTHDAVPAHKELSGFPASYANLAGADRDRRAKVSRIAFRASAAAAVLGVAAVAWWFGFDSGSSPALADQISAAATKYSNPARFFIPMLPDEAQRSEIEARIQTLRPQLRSALDQESRDPDPWQIWQRLYNELMTMGRWDEAIDEMKAFADYARKRYESEHFTIYYSVLYDLGNAYTTLGEYDTALEWHQKAVAVRKDFLQWRDGSGVYARRLDYQKELANTLAPQYWRLGELAAARGDMSTAWEYLDQTKTLLIEYFRAECAGRKITINEEDVAKVLAKAQRDAGFVHERSVGSGSKLKSKQLHGETQHEQSTLKELAELVVRSAALIQTADRSLDSMTVKAREHLFYHGHLLRIDEQAGLAAVALALGEEIGPYEDLAHAAETRLDFLEPLEVLHIALVLQDYPTALDAAERASSNTSPLLFEGYEPKSTIGPLLRAELEFFHGAAIVAGPGEQDQAALKSAVDRMKSAIEMVQDSAKALPEAKRAAFLKLFSEWNKILEQAHNQLSAG